jgi:hypothetical protein
LSVSPSIHSAPSFILTLPSFGVSLSNFGGVSVSPPVECQMVKAQLAYTTKGSCMTQSICCTVVYKYKI